MANNKMQVYCRSCFRAIVIAKYYPREWMVHDRGLDNTLNSFFTEHRRCFTNSNRDQLMWGDNMFGFRTETDDDGFITEFDPLRIIKINN